MSNGTDFEKIPRLKNDLLENPARFLDREIPEFPVSPDHPPKLEEYHDDEHDTTKTRLVRDEAIAPKSLFVRQRIASIDRLEVIRAWKAVERRLAARDERPVRDHVIALLDDRADELDEIGERPDRLEYRDEPREIPDKNFVFLDEDGEPRDRHGTAISKLQDLREDELATDGGADE